MRPICRHGEILSFMSSEGRCVVSKEHANWMNSLALRLEESLCERRGRLNGCGGKVNPQRIMTGQKKACGSG